MAAISPVGCCVDYCNFFFRSLSPFFESHNISVTVLSELPPILKDMKKHVMAAHVLLGSQLGCFSSLVMSLYLIFESHSISVTVSRKNCHQYYKILMCYTCTLYI